MREQTNRRGKIAADPAPEVVKFIISPAIKGDLERAYQAYLDVNKAHVLMLAECGIIEKDVAKAILEVTSEMAAMGQTPTFPIDPNREDIYFNLEHYLISRTGLEIGGQQHTARSRNDLVATVTRLVARNQFFIVCGLFNALRQTIIDLAKRNKEAVMAGYTHLQPSEPITFGHYCSAILNAMQRDYRRIARVYDSLNLSPLGGTSMGSSTFPINRIMTANLLGFDAPLNNSIDCVASRDYAMELTAAMAIAGNTFSRFSYDLYVWATPDYGYVEVDDSVAVCSSIMPQKKNPWTLEHIRGKASHLEGFFISVMNALKNTPYTHCQDVAGEGVAYLWQAFDEMRASIELLNVTAKGITLHTDRMVQTARGNFCTVTELANTLVRHDKISFRAAHEIVALVVDHMIKHNKKADEIGADVVNEIFMKLFNRKSSLTDKEIQLALDPVKNAHSKTILGGTAPQEVERQLQAIEAVLESDRAELKERMSAVNFAKASLEEKVKRIIA